jgi:hypothetical protein
VYRFIAQESGSPYTIRTAGGTKVIKDRGLLRYQFDVDTKGDADLTMTSSWRAPTSSSRTMGHFPSGT